MKCFVCAGDRELGSNLWVGVDQRSGDLKKCRFESNKFLFSFKRQKGTTEGYCTTRKGQSGIS